MTKHHKSAHHPTSPQGFFYCLGCGKDKPLSVRHTKYSNKCFDCKLLETKTP